VPNSESKSSQKFKKAYSQVGSHNNSKAKQTSSTESMLAKIIQMLEYQNLRLNKIDSSIK
jgi:hypothetical protein